MANEQTIIEQLFRGYGETRLLDRDFHGYRAAPLPLRMFFSMRVLESEIANGGLAQLLWNTFYHWRGILEDCAYAYRAIGAQAQVTAMSEIQGILELHEPECRAHIERAVGTRDLALFQEWYHSAERKMNLPAESLFYPSDALDALKETWIAANSDRP